MNRRERPLHITINSDGVHEIAGLISSFPERVKSSAVRAINRTLDGVQSDIVKEVPENWNVSKDRVMQALSVRRAALGDTTPSGELSVGKKGRARRIPLYEFSPDPLTVTNPRPSVGVSVEVRRGKRYKIAGSFIADTPVRGLNIYKRQNSRQGLSPDGRERIYKLVGLSVRQMITPDMQARIEANSRERFVKRFTHEMTEGFKHGGKK
ncbi:hypothetical protein [Geovibrio ferrireducens]|uniref:hypothetical protein n=1 Tax=Geovibrio ferrireducens TaxID=46201 RepID=UPI00224504AF|nr:hypothetical protein [Geovibrio ferrireducens]